MAFARLAEFLAALPRLAGPSGQRPHVVFNLFEGFAGLGQGEALVAGWIEAAGLPLTGSNAAALELVRDKARVKWLLRGAGLPTADFVLVTPDRPRPQQALEELLAGGPVIVKPAHEDASLGIGPHSVVSDAAALDEQIAQVRADYGPVLVERFIAGREFNAAVIALPEPRMLPLAEIEFAASLTERGAAGDLCRQVGLWQRRRSGHGPALSGQGRARSGPAGSSRRRSPRSRRPVVATTPESISAWPMTRASTFSK